MSSTGIVVPISQPSMAGVTCAVLAAVLTTIASTPVQAQSWPSKPIRWIIPYPTGGTSDFLARIVGQKLGEALGQSVLIDNRTGANGNIGTEVAARSAPDGYTMMLVASTFTINPVVYPKLPLNSERDFAPVTTLLWNPCVMAVHPSLPVTTVKQLVDLAKAKPDEINYGSGGNGNATHIAAELFASKAGVELTHVPYRGVGPSILALLAGEVKLMWASPVPMQPHLKSGKVRILAVTGGLRIASMPDVPTVSEAGVPGYVEGNWQMVLVPAGTPKPIVNRLHEEIVKIVKAPEVTAQILQTGADVIANTPAESAALVRTDIMRYGELVKALGIRAD